MAATDNSDEWELDLETFLKFLATRPDIVHRHPTNEYQWFINAFVFINSNLKRQEAVKTGQEIWRKRCICSADVCPTSRIVFTRGIEKMKELYDRLPGTLNAFFETVQENTGDSGWPTTEDASSPTHTCIEEPECVLKIDDHEEESTTAAPSSEIATNDHIEENNYIAVVNLCLELNISAEELLTPDVRNHSEFMTALANVAAPFKEYQKLKRVWVDQQSFVKKESKVSLAVSTVEILLLQMKNSLSELADLTVTAPNLAVMLTSYQQKITNMLQMLPVLFAAKEAFENAIPSLQSCLRAQKQRRSNKLIGGREYMLTCNNTLDLSWENALENIQEMAFNTGATTSTVKFSPLNLEQMQSFPNLKDKCHHEGLICIPGDIIAMEYGIPTGDKSQLQATVYQLVEYFPLLCIEKYEHFALIDFNDIVFNPALVSELLTLDKNMSEDGDTEPLTNLPKAKESIMFFKKHSSVALQHKFPELLTTMMDFIKLHGLPARARRKNGTSSYGVRLEDIKKHLIQNVQGLTTISKLDVYNLLQSTCSNTTETDRLKDALDVRIDIKACDIGKENINAHEYLATVGYVRQLCAEYPTECTALSCGNNAKVHIGSQAVSRYHAMRTFFPSDSKPYYMYNNFPGPGYLIEPNGYLNLVSKKENITVIEDKLGREVVDTPSSGPLFVYNRGIKNTSTSIVDHLSDITDIFNKNPSIKKPVLALITDSGPDWTPKSNLNQFFLGRFWKDNDFDMLLSCCYAPGNSGNNLIEHKWSLCSKWLAGVSLPACLPGESTPPAMQSIDPYEKTEKERKVFGNALDILNSYWDSKVDDDFKVTSIAVKDNDTDYRYKDYSEVKDMFNSSLRAIKSNPEKIRLLEEWRFLVKHMDRRWGFVCFRKGACGDNYCRCLETGRQATEVMKIPCSEVWSLPPITPDTENAGYYKTFRQQVTSLAFSTPDEHLKEVMIESCRKCKYVFTSVADYDRHVKLVHNGASSFEAASGSGLSTPKKPHKCSVCEAQFPTRYQLLKHQGDQGHKLKKGRPSTHKH